MDRGLAGNNERRFRRKLSTYRMDRREVGERVHSASVFSAGT